MESVTIHVNRHQNGWLATVEGNPQEGVLGHTMTEALRSLANYLEAKSRGLVAAWRAQGNGRGTESDTAIFTEPN
jgi:hypothetical protein